MSHVTNEAPPCGAAPIDIVSLSRHTAGDRRLVREVLMVFRNQSQQYLAALEDATDADGWRLAAHTLKGAARAIGATRVAALAEAAEAQAAARETYSGALKEIRQAMAETRRFIDFQLLDAAH